MYFELSNNHLELDLGLTKASVTIIEAEREGIEVEFSELRKNTVEEIFDISYTDGYLTIKEKTWRKTGMTPDFMNAGISTDLTLRIPQNLKIRGSVSTLSGDIMAKRLVFNGRLKTVSGAINLGEVDTTRLKAHSVVGGLSIDTLRGAISAKVISGSCSIQDGVFSEVSLSSVSGEIRVSGAFALKSNSSIHSVSGGIHLNINSYDGDYLTSVSTLSGTIQCDGDYPKDKVEIKKRMPFIKNHPFKNVMPDIKSFFTSFSKVMDDSDVEIKTEAESSTEKHVKTILDMVSDGKISVDEAEKLIKAIKE